MRKTTVHQLLLGVSLFALFVVSGYLVFVQTAVGQAFDYEAYFAHQDVSAAVVRFYRGLFVVVKIPTLVGIGLVLVAIGIFRRRFLMGVLAAVGLALTMFGAEYFKHELPRPDLSAPQGQVRKVFHQNTYPSGHTSFAMGIALAFLLVSPVRWRPWGSVVGGFFGALYASGVVLVGGHRPADPFGAIFWSMLCLSLMAAIVLYFSPQRYGVPERPHLLALAYSAFLALAVIIGAWLSTGWLGLELAEHNLPFLLSMSVIIFSAFAVNSWFGWVLSGEADSGEPLLQNRKAELSLT